MSFRIDLFLMTIVHYILKVEVYRHQVDGTKGYAGKPMSCLTWTFRIDMLLMMIVLESGGLRASGGWGQGICR